MTAAQAQKPFVDEAGTHIKAHLDEQIARVIFDFEGWRKFAGVRSARFRYYETSEAAEEADARPNTYVIGTGGGELDEHKLSGRLGRTCSAILVAEDLGVDDLPEYQMILREALRADTHTDPDTGEKDNPGPYELANIIKNLHNWSDRTDEQVYWWVRRILLAFRARERGDKPLRSEEFLARDGEHILYIPEEHRVCLTMGADTMNLSLHERPELRLIVLPEYASLQTLTKALLMLWYAGKRRWDARKRVRIQFVADQLSLNQYLDRDDVMFLGIEGGQFSRSATAFELADYLGVEKFPEVRRIAQAGDGFAQNPDEAKSFDLVSIVAMLNRYSDQMAPQHILNLVRDVYQTVRAFQDNFTKACPSEFDRERKAGRAKELMVSDLKVCMVASENLAMLPYLKGMRKADVVVLFTSHGRSVFQSFNASELHPNMLMHIAREILLQEAAKLGASQREIDAWTAEFDQIFVEAKESEDDGSRPMPGLNWWYLWLQGGGLMNGSPTHKAPRASALTASELGRAVIQGMVNALTA